MESEKAPNRPELPKDQVKQSISLGSGVIQSLSKPKSEHGLKLTCTDGHNNYVYGLPGPPFMRIGSTRTNVAVIACLRCGERLKGGADF